MTCDCPSCRARAAREFETLINFNYSGPIESDRLARYVYRETLIRPMRKGRRTLADVWGTDSIT